MYGNHNLDDINKRILKENITEWDKIEGARVGDFLKLTDGTYKRFTHEWTETIQTTLWGDGGAGFHLSFGCVSYSGGLDSGVNKIDIKQDEEIKLGQFWFFNHHEVKAHNGINFNAPCRVFSLIEGRVLR